ncbi:hypothetical protein [Nitratiruptor sp. YY09-18]|uniref:hypothetical protein n=1 Tax=Nitratiruptor sp. YY09-18 TaxID=2724901 RepID=UPI00191528B8|nr:hypothetical protein [Nitratiruptor sp. YY09-18]BCD68075.1 hypothetical protein NitYY0918_C0986 [Nitratiruptor sp. YY09-18]
MRKESKVTYLSINPYNSTFYLYDKNSLKKLPSLKKRKDNFHVSFLQTKDLIISTVNISKNIPDEDLKDVIEIKAYEELDLDPAIEYKIEFQEIYTTPDAKERKFQLFITEPSILHEVFDAVVNKIDYIDFIAPAPILLKTLYENEILERDNVDLFVYFQKNDAFLVLYKDGNLVYAKSLKYSFEDIAERLSELKMSNVSVEDVMQTLAQEGLKISDLDELQFYMQVFSEIFMHINDVLIYAKRANDIENIDRIFISSSVGYIKGIEEYAQTYLAQEATGFLFDYGIETNEPFVEDIHCLMILAAIDFNEKEIAYPNLTIFKRLPPLLKRPSGEVLVILAVSILLAGIYPLYNIVMSYKYRFDTAVLQKEYQQIHAKKVMLQTKIDSLKKQMQELKDRVANKEKELENRMVLLQQIYDKKVNYIMKAQTLADLTQDIVKFKIKTLNIDNNQSIFDLNVTAVDDKQITRFIKYISDNKSDRYKITTKEINKTDENSSVYTSKLKVEVR